MTGGILTGGLAPGSSGVSLVPTWGLTPGVVVRTPTLVFRLRASRASAFALRASRRASFGLAASRRTAFALRGNTLMPEYASLAFARGSDVTLTFTTPASQPVTGLTIALAVADSPGGTVRLKKSATITGTNAFAFTLAAADTASLSPGEYAWDVWDRDAGSNAPLAYGVLTLTREVAAYP